MISAGRASGNKLLRKEILVKTLGKTNKKCDPPWGAKNAADTNAHLTKNVVKASKINDFQQQWDLPSHGIRCQSYGRVILFEDSEVPP